MYPLLANKEKKICFEYSDVISCVKLPGGDIQMIHHMPAVLEATECLSDH